MTQTEQGLENHITLVEYLTAVINDSGYPDQMDGKLIQRQTQQALTENQPEKVEALLKIAKLADENQNLNASHQIRLYLTLGHLNFLTQNQASQDEIQEFIFNSPYQSDSYNPATDTSSTIINNLERAPEDTILKLVELNQANEPYAYQRLVHNALSKLSKPRQKILAENSTARLLSLKSPDELNQSRIDGAKCDHIETLLRYHYAHPNSTQLALELAESTHYPISKFSAKLKLIEFFLKTAQRLPKAAQLTQECVTATLTEQGRLFETFSRHPFFPDLATAAIKLFNPDQVSGWLKKLNEISPVNRIILKLTTAEINNLREFLEPNDLKNLITQLIQFSNKTPMTTQKHIDLSANLIKAKLGRLVTELAVPHPPTVLHVLETQGVEPAKKLAQRMGLNFRSILRSRIS